MEKDDDFINKLLTDFQNGSLLKDNNSASEKKEDQDDPTHCDDHSNKNEEEEDDQIYVYETVAFSEEEECGDLDDDREEERAYYDDKPNVVEDIEEEEAEDEDEWIYNDDTSQDIQINLEENGEDDEEEEVLEEENNSAEEKDDDVDDEEEGEEYDDNDGEEEGEGEGENTYEEKQIVIQPPRKRPRTAYNSDRLSTLKDDRILHIMSFLPMKDNVRTGILSKRWRYLWTDLATLNFKHSGHMNKGEILKFLDFVNYTLQLSACPDLKIFVLEYNGYINDHDMLVNRAIRSLSQRRAEMVYLHLNRKSFENGEDGYKLPQYLFTNSSWKVLSLSNCVVAPKGNIRWRSLNSLSLEYIELSDELASKILKGSLNLGSLKISSCVGLRFLNIRSKNLKEMVITHRFGSSADWSDDTVLKITAPHITSLALLGNFYRRRCRLSNVSSLVKADLDLKCDVSRDYEENHRYLFHLLEKLEHVEELRLGTWCTQVLSTVQLNQFDRLTLRCKSLSVYTNFMDLQCNLSTELLLIDSSCLETLKVDMSRQSYSNYDEKFDYKVDKDFLISLFSHLKTVHIINFSPSHEEYVLRLVQIVLENAKELQNMIIKTGNSGYSEWSSCLGSQRFIQLTRKIMRFPRCSPEAVVLI